MSDQDAELDQLRSEISCAAVLEQMPPAWRLDHKGSTRRALKYRRGQGEVIIVNHDGHGWWDPQSTAKGDVFDLVQFLDPSLNFGQVRQVLRPFVGLAPMFPAAFSTATAVSDRLLGERWASRPKLSRGSSAWAYLTNARGLPPEVLVAAGGADVVRQGPYGSPWFAHRCELGSVCHIEIRGPDFKGSVRGGHKALFALLGSSRPIHARLVLTEAPIDALSLAALESTREDTAYLATGGGMGPGTLAAIKRMLTNAALVGGCLLAGATDANLAGDAYATRHAEMAAVAGVPFARLRPTVGSDWNDVLRQARGL